MEIKKIFTTIFTLIISFSLFPAYLSADTISPFINEVSLKQDERTRESITYTNEGTVEREILLKAYGYDTKTEAVDKNIPILLRIDTDTFVINPGESEDIPYEIVLPENLEVGTYFNILILEPVPQSESSSITTSTSVSQIVRIDVYASDSELNKISDIPANISLEVINKGIPFIKPAEIKYTYTNISNYILKPEGEIQVFNEKQNTEPIYLKINKGEKILQQDETLTETFKIDTWNIYDLIYDKVVLGRFYNGVDGQYQGDQTRIESFKDELLIAGAIILFLFIISGESSKEKGRNIPKDYDDLDEEE